MCFWPFAPLRARATASERAMVRLINNGQGQRVILVKYLFQIENKTRPSARDDSNATIPTRCAFWYVVITLTDVTRLNLFEVVRHFIFKMFARAMPRGTK